MDTMQSNQQVTPAERPSPSTPSCIWRNGIPYVLTLALGVLLIAACTKEDHFLEPAPSVSVPGQPHSPVAESRVEAFDPNAVVSGTRTVAVRLPFQTEPVEMTVAVMDGYLVAEGDMILGRVEDLDRPGNEVSSRSVAILVDGETYRWPNGIIPYTIESGHPKAALIAQAIKQVDDNTVLKFVPRTNEKDYLIFRSADGCSAAVGRQGGAQYVNVGWCEVGNLVHEILHAAGMWHEHTRCDRDNFITVNTDNVVENKRYNYSKHCTDGIDLGAYDYGSIMHYPAVGSFAIDASKPIITPKPVNGVTPEIGQRIAMSDGDVAGINKLYARSLLFYENDHGQGEVYKLKPDGRIDALTAWSTGWRTTWDVVLRYTLHDKPYMFFYENDRGYGEIYETNLDGALQRRMYASSGWRKTWDIITTFSTIETGTSPLVDRQFAVFYDRTNSGLSIYELTSNGLGAQTYNTSTFPGNWDLIIPYSVGNQQFLLFYDRGPGRADIYKVSADGVLGERTIQADNWYESWSSITPFTIGNRTYLCLYDRTYGEMLIYQMKWNGNLDTPVYYSKNWLQEVDIVTPYTIDGRPYLMFYKGVRGASYTWELRDDGRIGGTVMEQTGWRKTWDAIVPL